MFWDLGDDVTQYGSTEAVGDLVRLQSIVWPYLQHGNRVFVNRSTGSARRRGHLGCCCYHYPRFGHRPLHPHIPDQVFPLGLLCCPCYQRSVRCRHHPRRMPYLPTSCIQLGPFYSGWPLRKSEIAGLIHRDIQPADGCDRGRAADARALGFANGCGQKDSLEHDVWVRCDVGIPTSAVSYV